MKLQLTTRHGVMALHYPQDYIAQQLLSRGEYEWYIIDIIKSLCQGKGSGTILDIGANIGTVTVPIAAMLPDCKVHAFEIQPGMITNLAENLQLNNITNVTIHNYGLGNETQTILVTENNYESANNIGAFSLNPLVWANSDISFGTSANKISVDVKPLDTVNTDSPILCIKLDVEGYELMVLKGALTTLKNNNYPPIVYEAWAYNPWWAESAAELQQFLKDLGYNLQQVDDTMIATHD